MELHSACNGRWDDFWDRGIEQDDLDTWLGFTGTFLSNLGKFCWSPPWLASFPSMTRIADVAVKG